MLAVIACDYMLAFIYDKIVCIYTHIYTYICIYIYNICDYTMKLLAFICEHNILIVIVNIDDIDYIIDISVNVINVSNVIINIVNNDNISCYCTVMAPS